MSNDHLSMLALAGLLCAGCGDDAEANETGESTETGNTVGTDGTGVYESSWGVDSAGAERKGTSPSNMCGVTTKDIFEECP